MTTRNTHWIRKEERLSLCLSPFVVCSHNCNTGRWLTRFRAVWDPKQERCFAVGSMARPRQVQLFRDTGALLHAFRNPDCLGSVCSINVLHPSRNILVGGNSSGRLHVFKEWKQRARIFLFSISIFALNLFKPCWAVPKLSVFSQDENVLWKL